MASHIRSGLFVGLTFLALACAGDDNGGQPDPVSHDAGFTAPQTVADSGAVVSPVDAGSTPPVTARDSGSVAVIDSGAVTPGDSGSGADAALDSGSQSQNDAGSAEAGSTGGTSLTGTYGSLGAVKPIVSSFWISTGLETILYLSSTPLTCAQIMAEGGRWLLMVPSDGQVLEIVVRGAAKVGTVKIPSAEANYAQGSKSSATEKVASSGTLMFTKVEAMGVIEGSVMATYSSGSVMGTFHAEYCAGGQEW